MTHEYVPVGVPFLRSLNVRPFRIDLSDLMFISEAFNSRLAKSALKPGDVVVVRTGTPGVAAVIPVSLPRANCADLVVIRPGPCLDPRYLAYYINGVAQSHVTAHVVGAVQQHFNIGSAKQIQVVLPSLREQRMISNVLGALDDKIELNGRLSQTLEAIAAALFQSWFVDFDPTTAKAAGQSPIGLDAATADLFPSAFEDSELGRIPRGWRITRVADSLKTVLGGTPSRDNPANWGGEVPWINSGAVNQSRVVTAVEFLTEHGLQSSNAQLMPPGTTLIAITGATLGQISRLEIQAAANQSVVGILPSTMIPSEFVFLWIRATLADLLSRQTGAAQQHINKQDVNEHLLLIPAAGVLAAYAQKARPIFDLIAAKAFESITLASLRSTLLPKLLSGGIHSREAEHVIGAVA